MLVALVDVAAGGVGLPDLDQRVRHRPAVAVEHAAGDDDALAQRLAVVLAGEVGVGRGDGPSPYTGPVGSCSASGRRISGRSGARSTRRAVVGMQIGRVDGARPSPSRDALDRRAAHPPAPARRRCAARAAPRARARLGGALDLEVGGAPAAAIRSPRRLVGGHPGMDARSSVSSHVSGSGSSSPRSVMTAVTPPPVQAERSREPGPSPKPDRRAEVELLDERARRLLEDHERLLARRRDLGRAAAARQPHLRVVVVADHGAVEIAVAIDLGGAQEPDVDPAALQPVGEDLGDADTTASAVSASSPSPIESGRFCGLAPIVPLS